jgi:hypothetical protein
MTHWSFNNVLFSLQLFVYFLLLLLLLSSSFIALWPDSTQGVISVFLYLLRLALRYDICALRYDIFWRKFHGLLRRMYIVLLPDGILCRHLSVPLDLLCHLVLGFLHWYFCLDDLSIIDRWVLKSPTATVLGSICGFKSFNVCLMKLDALTLGAFKLIIIISS